MMYIAKYICDDKNNQFKIFRITVGETSKSPGNQQVHHGFQSLRG